MCSFIRLIFDNTNFSFKSNISSSFLKLNPDFVTILINFIFDGPLLSKFKKVMKLVNDIFFSSIFPSGLFWKINNLFESHLFYENQKINLYHQVFLL